MLRRLACGRQQLLIGRFSVEAQAHRSALSVKDTAAEMMSAGLPAQLQSCRSDANLCAVILFSERVLSNVHPPNCVGHLDVWYMYYSAGEASDRPHAQGPKRESIV